LLPAALLSLDAVGDGFAPRYLRSRDEVWIRSAAGEYADLVGQPRAAVERAWADRIEPALRAAGASRFAALGVKHILDRAHRSEVRAAAPPERIREIVFPLAARGGSREEVFARAGEALGIAAGEVDAGLFADRAGAQILAAPRVDTSPGELALAYNLALVQGLLLRAERVRVDVTESVRAVVRYAKLRGLLATFTLSREGWTRMDASGPLALFRNTLKYGRALATFFPTLTATPTYRLQARCQLGRGSALVRVETGDPVPRVHALPRETDSAVERALVRDVRRLGTPWTIERETTVLRAGSRLFFPDFTLVRGDQRVLVEVVGYYTPEYLARKCESLRLARAPRLIVCVDDALDCGEGGFASTTVLRFRKRVDAARLLELAESGVARPPSCR
jgi:predicted nuclease of restriction endonuclease-like RecB superfamily